MRLQCFVNSALFRVFNASRPPCEVSDENVAVLLKGVLGGGVTMEPGEEVKLVSPDC